jgi:hypothetical protein
MTRFNDWVRVNTSARQNVRWFAKSLKGGKVIRSTVIHFSRARCLYKSVVGQAVICQAPFIRVVVGLPFRFRLN